MILGSEPGCQQIPTLPKESTVTESTVIGVRGPLLGTHCPFN